MNNNRFHLVVVSLLLAFSASAQLSERMPWETTPVSTKPEYHFTTDWRIELGFQQPSQRSDSTANNTYFNGGKIGFLVDFNLPYHLGIQTGLRYEMTYGVNTQHYRSADNSNVNVEYIQHRMQKHALSMPIRVVFIQQLWRELALTLYTGPTIQIGLSYYDNPLNALSDSTLSWLQNYSPDPKLIHAEPHDYYSDGTYYRTNVQWGIGGGLQWMNWRLEGGYNFGLNNLCKYRPATGKISHMNEWSWEVSLIYTINYRPFDPNYSEKAWERREKRRVEREQRREKPTPTIWRFGTGFDD